VGLGIYGVSTSPLCDHREPEGFVHKSRPVTEDTESGGVYFEDGGRSVGLRISGGFLEGRIDKDTNCLLGLPEEANTLILAPETCCRHE
jgi:hypothetical protein